MPFLSWTSCTRKGMKTAKILIDNYIVRVESKVADFADTAEN